MACNGRVTVLITATGGLGPCAAACVSHCRVSHFRDPSTKTGYIVNRAPGGTTQDVRPEYDKGGGGGGR